MGDDTGSGAELRQTPPPGAPEHEDPAVQLARFRADRDRRQRRGMLVVVGTAIAVNAATSSIGELIANTLGSTGARIIVLMIIVSVMGVVYLAPFDFDHEFSSVSVRHPTLELGLLGCWYSQEIVNTLGYGAKYGHLIASPRWDSCFFRWWQACLLP